MIGFTSPKTDVYVRRSDRLRAKWKNARFRLFVSIVFFVLLFPTVRVYSKRFVLLFYI